MPTLSAPRPAAHPLAPSTMGLLSALQRHGLSVEVLEAWVSFLEAGETGSFTFHAVQGQLKRYERHSCGALGTAHHRPAKSP